VKRFEQLINKEELLMQAVNDKEKENAEL